MSDRQNQRRASSIIDVLKCTVGRPSKIDSETAGAKIASELLAEQHLDIGFVVDD